MDGKNLLLLAERIGFSHAGRLEMSALIPRNEVREMCGADRCSRFAKSWSCPPACGPVSFFEKRFAAYNAGILVQTTGRMSDPYDYDVIKETEIRHKKSFDTLVRQAKLMERTCMPLGSGSCTRCRSCTYPDRPCRYPDKCYPSMEAAGLWVSDVCRRSGIDYNYGENTITYTAAVLYNEPE